MRKRTFIDPTILEHCGQLKKPGLELLQNPECLYSEIMTQMKKRKANETEAIQVQSKIIEQLSNQCCCQ